MGRHTIPPLMHLQRTQSSLEEPQQLSAENLAPPKIEDCHYKTSVYAATVIVKIGAVAFGEFVVPELMDSGEWLNGVTIHQIFDHIMLCFTDVSQLKVNSNLIRFNKPMNPSFNFAVYIRRQERCHEVMFDAEVPISTATMVSAQVKHMAATCGLDVA